MLEFELKRLIKGKNFLFILLAIFLIIITNLLLQSVYDSSSDIINEKKFLNIYNSFSQVSFLIFSPIIGTAISKDKENNYTQFYRQLDVSSYNYFCVKLFVYCIAILIPTNLILVFIQCIYTINNFVFMKLLVIIDLNLVYCILAGFIISLVVKKSIYSSMGMIFFWFGISIINIVPIPIIKGNLSITDTNSFVTAYVSSLLGVTPNSFFYQSNLKCSFFQPLFVQIIWIVIMMTISMIIIKQKGKYKYV